MFECSRLAEWLRFFVSFAILMDLNYCPILPEGFGLDPSWMNGLTHAAELHLQFGHDVIFTFGPLGYLIAGVKTPESFRQIFAARVALAFVFSIAAVWYCSALSSRHFLLSISAIAVASVLGQDRAASTASGVVIVAMLILDRRSSRRPHIALVLGVLAGIGALTKFTIGVQSAGAIGSVLLFGAFQELRGRESGSLDRISLAIFGVAASATMSAVLKSCSSHTAMQIIGEFALWCACILALLEVAVTVGRSANRAFIALAVATATAVALIIFSDLTDFVRNALQISFGYSDAMIYAPDNGAPGIAFGLLLLILIAIVALLERPYISFGAAAAFVVLCWLNFKEGYVRQDPGHVVEFLIPVLFMFALLTAAAKTRVSLGVSLMAFLIALSGTVSEMSPSSAAQKFALSRLSAPIVDVVDAFGPWPAGRDPLIGMAADDLDAGTAAKLASLPIDVQPTEATVAFANGLAWSPEPVFQSYSAYTPSLDLSDADALAMGHRRVLVDMATIDGRNFMEESPLARRALLCDYRLDPQFGETPVQVRGGERFVVLSPSPSDRCQSRGARSIGAIAWDRSYAVPPATLGSMTFLALHLRYSLRGSIAKTAFRGPLVTIGIRDRSGVTVIYRLLTQNATNGFLISPNPLSRSDLARVFAGTLPATTASFSIHTDDPSAFRPNIEGSFENVSFASE